MRRQPFRCCFCNAPLASTCSTFVCHATCGFRSCSVGGTEQHALAGRRPLTSPLFSLNRWRVILGTAACTRRPGTFRPSEARWLVPWVAEAHPDGDEASQHLWGDYDPPALEMPCVACPASVVRGRRGASRSGFSPLQDLQTPERAMHFCHSSLLCFHARCAHAL